MLTMLTEVPGQTPHLDRAGVEAARLVRAARDELVSESSSVTYELLARARGVSENTARQWVQRRRRAGILITVDYDGTVLIPSFQFDADYDDVIVPVARIIETFTSAGMSGWAVWRWFQAVNPWIERRPVALVAAGDWDRLAWAARQLAAPSEPPSHPDR